MTEKENEAELIQNKYEFVDWVYKSVLKKVHADFKQEREQLDAYKKKLQVKYDSASESIRKINGYIENIYKYEENLKKKEVALQDRKGNLQNIYNKMIEIEKKLNAGEWPGVLPPLNLDMSDE